MKIFERLPHIDFMKYKGVALAASWSIIIICFLWMRPWKGAQSHVRLGMQFTGGIDMMVAFKGEVHQDVLRNTLYQGGVQDAAVVAYNDKPGTSVFSIKVKARKGQDEKDSSAQIKQITDALKHLDASGANDHRADLNTESVGAIKDTWVKTNPLGVSGDETALQAAYEPWVTKVTRAREQFSPMSSYDQLPSDLPPQLRASIEKTYRLGTLSILKNESFSPSISGEWTWKTLQAVFWAMGAILLYVIFRFTVSFSVGGIVALIHDILMALGLFVVFGFEFSVPVVASFLILIGYSMADTIVVFDRIRENSHKPEYRRVDITKLINDSINQTLSRTILTSLSVLFVAFCLLVWGGHALRDLSFPIFIGVITGTYSSIFIASPVVVYWDHFFGGKEKIKQHAHGH
jgi:preprotein translocase subunit SecF